MSEERKSVDIKQVIVLRKDLKNQEGHKIRTGKLVTQGSHASSQVFFQRGIVIEEGGNKFLKIPLTDEMGKWLEDRYAKITLKVESEEQLLDTYQQALDQGLPCALIQDAGLTEFNEPTYTAIAIGPAHKNDLDKITGGLSLL